MSHRTRRLQVGSLARVEGEGALQVVLDGDRVVRADLRIYEPPRYFEGFLRGRDYTEVPDIAARICGICPVAYQVSGANAIEDACEVDVGEDVRTLRRLLYCGEWIASHALHVYLLHAPDFLGYPDVVALAERHRTEVERGLALKRAGNAIMELVGGRAIHPINPCVGGFHRSPTVTELGGLEQVLRPALDDAVRTAQWVAGFEFPDAHVDAEFLALHDPDRYAIENGSVHASTALAFAPAHYLEHVVEHQVPHSTALHASLDGRRFLTGPLARFALNADRLSPLAREVARAAGLDGPCRNPYRSIVVRAVEIVYAVEEALRIIGSCRPPDPPAAEVLPRAGVGHGVSEAPRGLLYHRYELAADGSIRTARIVPPTAQNQAAIEDDLARLVAAHSRLSDAELTAQCERAVRNHDPCISCATHFLDVAVERR